MQKVQSLFKSLEIALLTTFDSTTSNDINNTVWKVDIDSPWECVVPVSVDWRECHDFSWVDPKQSKFAVKCFWVQNHSKSHFHLEQVKLRSLEGTSYLSLPKCKYMNALKMKNCSTGKLILWDGFLDNHVTMIIILKAESLSFYILVRIYDD